MPKRWLHATRAKAHVVALNHADHHAGLVRRCQVNRTAFDGVAGFEVLRFVGVDQLGACC